MLTATLSSKFQSCKKNEEVASEIIRITEQAHVIPLNTSLALMAAEMAKQDKLATAYTIIYATAQFYQVKLVTSDKHFTGLTDIIFLEKT